MPAGRPTKKLQDMQFPSNWKDIIFEMSLQGCSDVEIRAKLLTSSGVKAKTIEYMWYKLQEIDEEFSRTVQIAHKLCNAWWEREGREGLKAQVFNTGLWYANMKNRFGWADKKESGLLEGLPEGSYVQIYRPEKNNAESVASSSRRARASI